MYCNCFKNISIDFFKILGSGVTEAVAFSFFRRIRNPVIFEKIFIHGLKRLWIFFLFFEGLEKPRFFSNI